jgi:hypothetical protein
LDAALANILRDNGIEPAPERGAHTRWSTFLKAHWECLAATDFLSVEICTMRGLVTQHVLFFIDLASRSVHVAGITPHPDNSWMTQIARNVTDVGDGFLRGTRLPLVLPRFRAAELHIFTRQLLAQQYDKQRPPTDRSPPGSTGRVRPHLRPFGNVGFQATHFRWTARPS